MRQQHSMFGSQARGPVTLAGVPSRHIALGPAALWDDGVLAQQVQRVDGPVHLLRHRTTELGTADGVPATAESGSPAFCLTLVAWALSAHSITERIWEARWVCLVGMPAKTHNYEEHA